MDWFLYDNGLRHEWVNDFNNSIMISEAFSEDFLCGNKSIDCNVN